MKRRMIALLACLSIFFFVALAQYSHRKKSSPYNYKTWHTLTLYRLTAAPHATKTTVAPTNSQTITT